VRSREECGMRQAELLVACSPPRIGKRYLDIEAVPDCVVCPSNTKPNDPNSSWICPVPRGLEMIGLFSSRVFFTFPLPINWYGFQKYFRLSGPDAMAFHLERWPGPLWFLKLFLVLNRLTQTWDRERHESIGEC
jgi:hypothetical protein